MKMMKIYDIIHGDARIKDILQFIKENEELDENELLKMFLE